MPGQGRGRGYRDYEDEDYDRRGSRSSSRGGSRYWDDEDDDRRMTTRSRSGNGRHDDEDGDRHTSSRPRDEYGRFESADEGRYGSSRSRSMGRYDRDDDYDSEFRGGSRRGYAAMDRDERGGRGRDWDEDDRYSSTRSRPRDEYGRFESADEDRGRSRRGFAAMDPEERREIARMGGRASHGGSGRDWNEDDRYSSSRSRSRGRYEEYDDDRGGRSRRGFAAMDPEEQREIARRGGIASHEYGRGHEFTSQEAREAGRRGGIARTRY